ncbi:hypothetical protein R5R35_010596 [Gryllus longicercus]|uniref:Odorant binding protein n=1 Tax=Gryllus longicercus TaxID=2509291 RepID=A0AAN9VCN8_9ORTH
MKSAIVLFIAALMGMIEYGSTQMCPMRKNLKEFEAKVDAAASQCGHHLDEYSHRKVGELPNTKEFKKFTHCTMEALGLTSPGNKINRKECSKFLSKILSGEIEKLVNACAERAEKEGGSHDDVCYSTLVCLVTQIHKSFEQARKQQRGGY